VYARAELISPAPSNESLQMNGDNGPRPGAVACGYGASFHREAFPRAGRGAPYPLVRSGSPHVGGEGLAR